MNTRHLRTPAWVLLALLAGCGSSPSGTDTQPSVAITTVRPVQRTFHDTVYAWGQAAADSTRLLHLSLAHGGLVQSLSVTPGEAVHKGQALLRMVTEPTALSAYRQAENALEQARSDLARTRRMASQHLATLSQLAAARKAVADAQASMQAQRELGSGQAASTLHAPSDGVVTALHVGRGDRIAAHVPLLDFSPARALVAQLGVQPDQSRSIRTGMPVRLNAVYGGMNASMGTVDMVGHAVDPANGLVPVRATIPVGMKKQLMAGSPLQGNIQTTDFKAWAVPRGAVLSDARGHYLFQVKNRHAVRVDVKVMQPDGGTLGVTGKLQPDLPVIVSGAYELSNGDAVRESKR